ncbi:MAG: hypothetical protein HY000_27515 [Planctomycetes bacterium]|nr:hypothetical protein [Planctomycetota bacterium]
MNRTVQAWLRSFPRSLNTSKSKRQVRQQPTPRRPFQLEQLELRALVSHAIGEHAHPHPTLQILIDGQDLTIPANIGVTPTRLFGYHTHDTSGQMHYDGNNEPSGLDPVGSAPRFTTLKDFFDVWRTIGTPGTPQNNPNAFFSSTRIMDRFADATHAITFTVNGQPNNEFENYSLHPGDAAVISLEEIVNQAPMGNAQTVNVLPSTTSSITLTGDDGNPEVTQTLSFRVQTLPTGGSLRDSGGNPVSIGATLPTPNLSYTPGSGFSGNDSFTFVVRDNGGTQNAGHDTSAPATVSIAAATNHAPTANTQTANMVQDTAKSITLTGDDGDAGVTQALSFQVQSVPTNGTLRDSGGNAVTIGTTLPSANVSYTPNAGFTGGDNFSFIVKDNGDTASGGQDTSTSATVSINVTARTTNPPGAFDGTTRLLGHRLMVHGGPADNVMDFALNAAGNQLDLTLDGGTPRTFNLSDVHDLCLAGGPGNDTITIDSDIQLPAHILGGTGNDQITGGSGRDHIHGGRGKDVIDGGAGNDRVFGDRGRDSLVGGDGNDWLWGGPAFVHHQRRDSDTIDGGGGNDHIEGGAGRDSLLGGGGNDRIFGGLGRDSLDGGPGRDMLHGGPGRDRNMNPDPADRVFGIP